MQRVNETYKSNQGIIIVLATHTLATTAFTARFMPTSNVGTEHRSALIAMLSTIIGNLL